jgi:bifunctional N-acetylglucosamine-1-phosphate-uridyltransferase/glucosamine-1-phosphate-acetyltransferase GlmU-like protein
MDARLAVVIMAAGRGTRMNNPAMAKVMYTIANRPMVEHVVDLAHDLHASRVVAIVGWQKDTVIDHLRQKKKAVTCVEQNPQRQGMRSCRPRRRWMGSLVMCWFSPGRAAAEKIHGAVACVSPTEPAAATILTAVLDDPIAAASSDRRRRMREGIVEHKDATEEQRHIREINSGIYVFDKQRLFDGLQHITPNNVQKEYYLTDVFQHFWRNQYPVRAIPATDAIEIQGINTVQQLEDARKMFMVRQS